ncbi:MAG: YigZ family protein [Proteobacteria bacterium]|nr:YigZ family protein [Pseudomonadota bacterium]
MPRFTTIAGPFEFEADPIKGSRFIALLRPVSTEDEALELVRDARSRWPGASHHCWAFALKDGRTRSNDDGEPGGSAGRPILAQIEGHGITDVSVVVMRWFGGTKLGVGGLMRAYGGTAGKALDRAEPLEVIPVVEIQVEHDYDDTGTVQAIIGARGLVVRDTQYDARVQLRLSMEETLVDAVVQEITDRTSGRATIDR